MAKCLDSRQLTMMINVTSNVLGFMPTSDQSVRVRTRETISWRCHWHDAVRKWTKGQKRCWRGQGLKGFRTWGKRWEGSNKYPVVYIIVHHDVGWCRLENHMVKLPAKKESFRVCHSIIVGPGDTCILWRAAGPYYTSWYTNSQRRPIGRFRDSAAHLQLPPPVFSSVLRHPFSVSTAYFRPLALVFHLYLPPAL